MQLLLPACACPVNPALASRCLQAVQVTVGTDGPACVITQQPASVIPAPSFSFGFVSDPADPTVSYACQLTGSALSAQSFVACTSPK